MDGNQRTEQVIRAMLAMQRFPWEQGVCAQALYEAGREEIWIPSLWRSMRSGRRWAGAAETALS